MFLNSELFFFPVMENIRKKLYLPRVSASLLPCDMLIDDTEQLAYQCKLDEIIKIYSYGKIDNRA